MNKELFKKLEQHIIDTTKNTKEIFIETIYKLFDNYPHHYYLGNLKICYVSTDDENRRVIESEAIYLKLNENKLFVHLKNNIDEEYDEEIKHLSINELFDICLCLFDQKRIAYEH